MNCNDGIHTNITVTFNAGGGAGAPITGIEPGTICTVIEQDTASFPTPNSVSYTPPGADTTGVTITAETAVSVSITNDFSAVPPATGNVRVLKTLVAPPAGVTVPASYTAHLVCNDGTDTTVTLPGTGGEGTPSPVAVAAGAQCVVSEDSAALPPGWVITYTVGTGTPSTISPLFSVTPAATLTVTITNDATAVTPTTEPTTAPTTPTTVPTTAPTTSPAVVSTLPATLPATGSSPGKTTIPLVGGAFFVLLGLGLIVVVTRRRAAADRS